MALTAKKVYAILKRQISDMEAKIKTPIIYRGTVATADLLPLNPDIGDMYNIESKSIYGEAGMNVAWNGVVWDTMGAPIDMSLYIKSSELADWVKQQNKPTYTAEEVGALPADTKIPSKTSDLQNDSGFLTKIPDNYLSGTDKTLSVSGKAADAKTVGDKNVELSANISKKLNKNQGSENSGKIAGINESGDIVPMFPASVDYNEETNCLEFGSDQKMELNKGINLDSTLTKTGYAADAGTVGEITNSLKEDISNKITKFYASSQGETHLADSDNGKIQDMMIYGKSSQDGVPTPENPVEIKSVVNPTVKVCGKNLVDASKVITGDLQEGIVANGNNYITDYVEIDDSEEYIISGCLKNNYENAFYDENKQFTRRDFNYTIIPQKGEKYVRIEYVNNGDKKIMFEKGSEATSYEPYHEQTVTLPYTLNAIPVSSGGNVTIDGQQYIADYVDVERGKLVRCVAKHKLLSTDIWEVDSEWSTVEGRHTMWLRHISPLCIADTKKLYTLCTHYICHTRDEYLPSYTDIIIQSTDGHGYEFLNVPYTLDEWKTMLNNSDIELFYAMATPEEIDLTSEEITAFKALATYYPVTNISANSEQLDGYTVFNYPISMANGWNYVKKQLNDNRDYIYDMDLQSAEAYVNSEYAVALTELEV